MSFFSRRITERELQQVLYKATSLYVSFTFILMYLTYKTKDGLKNCLSGMFLVFIKSYFMIIAVLNAFFLIAI